MYSNYYNMYINFIISLKNLLQLFNVVTIYYVRSISAQQRIYQSMNYIK